MKNVKSALRIKTDALFVIKNRSDNISEKDNSCKINIFLIYSKYIRHKEVKVEE